MEFKIRPYHPSDLTALYHICLQTGNNGGDASHLYRDPDLLGHYYAGPYVTLEPELCFVVTGDGSPCGYILGTRDSERFRERCEQEWFPPLRERYPLPEPNDYTYDAHVARLIHRGYILKEGLEAYPAHLHIDLLPAAQGHGMGRRLMTTFLDKLRTLAVPGVHLGVAKQNPHAIGFYEHLGFHEIKALEYGLIFGMKLS